tara:strand:+ start:176 stop:367 length:192 start_codon:yes stop_codon:yes gene_type:complete
MTKETYAIIRRYKTNEKSSTYNIVGEKLYGDISLANSLCADFASREERHRVSFTVVAMPFNHI